MVPAAFQRRPSAQTIHSDHAQAHASNAARTSHRALYAVESQACVRLDPISSAPGRTSGCPSSTQAFFLAPHLRPTGKHWMAF
ncbi:hypothetical protein NUW54_g9179 [Trametes sanguinea]|uniref:Uncharacterized protein n=1 Tax=Trametes sanguinea TaxID=158606 RepID=A0ACC1PB06_9APHY|nr:hypothetical protein NUW54_g9179 [Trametes sanguinea]